MIVAVRLANWLGSVDDSAWDLIVRIWQFELFHLQGRPLTFGQLIIALFVLIVGLLFSRRLSRWLTKRAFHRVIHDPSMLSTVETVGFYAFAVFFTLYALHLASIPLTVFTIAGGALAIGFGFGSQNVVKNFISGLILMFERPIKVGDFIELSGKFGRVQRIGFRSTRILALGNKNLIFPNSVFLEQDILNWTLNDPMVRASVTVGVAYGSPTELVEKLLLQSVEELPQARKAPPPSVYFQDFGDNSLNFQVFFSINITELPDKILAESRLRFIIDRLFRENSITIAFPQRDLHLDTAKPLEVRLKSD